MRIDSIWFVMAAAGALTLGCAPASAAKRVPERSSKAGSVLPQGCWRVDHYVYDGVLHRNWAVLLDCEHPSEPSRMVLVPGLAKVPQLQVTVSGQRASRQGCGADGGAGNQVEPEALEEVRSGEAVAVASGPAAPAVFALPGTAEETAVAGQTIRVRLKVNGAIVRAVVRGPHLVELVAGSKPAWREP